jgi:REP element-mobilizing transposase RayT
MTLGLRRFHQSRQSHFLTFSCYHRQPGFNSPDTCDLFLACLEEMRRRFSIRIYGYVVMPEHVHLLLSEPDQKTLADAMHYLKLSFAKRLKGNPRIPHPTVLQSMTVPQSMMVPQVRGRSVAPNLGSPDGLEKDTIRFWQARYYEPQCSRRRRVHGKTPLPASKPRGSRTGQAPRRLEMEQFPTLRSA